MELREDRTLLTTSFVEQLPALVAAENRKARGADQSGNVGKIGTASRERRTSGEAAFGSPRPEVALVLDALGF